MTRLGHDRYCDEIVHQTDRTRALLAGADLTARVPSCPEWTLGELVRHVGRAHRWVEAIVRTRADEDVPEDQVPDFGGPADSEPAALEAWLADGAEKTAATLREAGAGTEVWSWAWERSAGFWARRMAHETVVHRADAALAVSRTYEVEPDIGADTIDEWLEIVAFSQAHGDPEAADLRGGGRSILLRATDAPQVVGAEWLIEFGEHRFDWRRGSTETSDATVELRGALADVLLVFQRRLAPGGDRVEVLGDAKLLDFWLERTSFG
jgi:uncharacterized protein (TIGR03083 family)